MWAIVMFGRSTKPPSNIASPATGCRFKISRTSRNDYAPRIFMANLQSANTATPADLGYGCPPNGNRTKPPGSPGRTMPVTGRANSRPFRGSMAKWCGKFPPGEIVRILVRHRAEENSARRILKRVGCNLKKIRFVVHPTNRGWTRDSGPIFVKRPSPLSLSHPMGEGGRRPGEGKPKPPSFISISTAGPNTPTGARTRRFPKPPRGFCAKNFSTPNAMANRSSLKAAASR